MEIPKRTTSSLGRSVSLRSQAVRAVLPGPAKPSWNMNRILVLAWMHWLPYALGTRRFGYGCAGDRMPLEHEQNSGLGMDALVTVCCWNTIGIIVWAWMHWLPYALGTRTELCFGHGCTGYSMPLEHERNYALGMDALLIACTRTGTTVEFRFGHGCTGYHMLLEHERNYGLGMDALVTACS